MTLTVGKKSIELYDAALEVAEEGAAGFPRTACQGDAELRREVESLLAYDQQAQQLLDRPAMQMTAEKLAAEPPSLSGGNLVLTRFRLCWVPAGWERFTRPKTPG